MISNKRSALAEINAETPNPCMQGCCRSCKKAAHAHIAGLTHNNVLLAVKLST
jgi:hypothetical protein